MMSEDETNRDIYFRAETGQISDLEKQSVYEKVFSNPRSLSYYTILSFGLLFRCSPINLKRLKKLFQIFIETDQKNLVVEDRLKAIITSVCNYWGEAALFEDELKAVLDHWDFDCFPDACITATSSFALLTFSTRSLSRLKYLKEHTLKRMDEAGEIERRILIGGCITASTGELLERNDLIEKYMKKANLRDLAFEIVG